MGLGCQSMMQDYKSVEWDCQSRMQDYIQIPGMGLSIYDARLSINAGNSSQWRIISDAGGQINRFKISKFVQEQNKPKLIGIN